VKRIDDFLKYFGLSCIAFGLLLVVLLEVFFGPYLPDAACLAMAFGGITFFIGCLSALSGFLQCETAAPAQKTVFGILKYFGLFCVVSAVVSGLWLSSAEGQLSRAIITLSSGLVVLVIAALYAFAKRR